MTSTEAVEKQAMPSSNALTLLGGEASQHDKQGPRDGAEMRGTRARYTPGEGNLPQIGAFPLAKESGEM